MADDLDFHSRKLRPEPKKTSHAYLPIIGPFLLSLSVLYAESNSPFWDSFGVFSSKKSSFHVEEPPNDADKKKEEEKPVRFFSAAAFKHPYEIKVFQEYFPNESPVLESIPGFTTKAPSLPRINLQRREFFSLYPAFGREEIFVMGLAMSQTKDSKAEAYVGTTSEKRAFDPLTDVRSTTTALPGGNQNLSKGLDNQAGNILFGYLLGRAGIQMDVGWRMAGNNVGLAIPESAKSSIGISYSLISNSSALNKMDFFLQFSGIKRFNDKAFLAVDIPPAFRGWQQGYEYYVNPGFSISTKNLSFEGLVRLPLHQPFPNTDGLLTPEVQGLLGVKYRFSESSPNNTK
ncbi:hypothetical protein EHO59_10330 [Leptospira semungkisensis]|uniref:Uncharacterized protein n=1 Tax=Leptospira semungkisensis TaxID=2484985 RepID=A0A4R9FZ37_9LEPT|nr:hypothetical protein [Leptospira semungkisensis]TGK03915.1 hypothetical protein EHO59_10330 [Leptospira semungkisensis]